MKTHALLLILGLATLACESPTSVEDVSSNAYDLPPQEPERTDTLRLTGTVTLNEVPREAIVELTRWQSRRCPFVPYAIGCGFPVADLVVEVSTPTDAEGRYELSGVLSGSRALSCADHRSLRVTFTDPDLQGLRKSESLGDDLCGYQEFDLAFVHFGVRGVLRIDGEPAPKTTLGMSPPTTLIRYADGATDVGSIWVNDDGEFHVTVPADEFDSAVCGLYADATLHVTLPDGRTSDPVSLYALPADECALRPIVDVEVDM